eukprot:CAMPEP_0196808632 /NCGR_PEP_ID=MMETSP1362-20130617/8618_1 /TAXON_ID=163516 /ORGANISM="Leptocylindrus danicus, Strain CCMP1856" /LENGTH=480 /DNA_ID=CAMNT_0042183041 /DNA_START=16 /DNA_END=1458 /DNA_ORIENTATION=+
MLQHGVCPIEVAKSGRSTCKSTKCKEKIEKGELRIAKKYMKPDSDVEMSSYYHPECIPIPKEFKKNVEDFVAEGIEDETPTSLLGTQEGVQRLVDLIKSDRKSKNDKSAEASGSKGTKLERAKAAFAESQRRVMEEDGEAPPKKKAKKAKGEPKDDHKTFDNLTDLDRSRGDIYAIYAKMKIDDLKDVLRWNKCFLTGNKDFLLLKCIDGHMNGRLGYCPSCKYGRLKFPEDHRDGERVVCNGIFNEEANVRQECSYSCQVGDAARLKWFTEKPTEEEEAQMEKEQYPEKAENSSVALKMADCLGSVKFDLNSSDGIKAAVSEYLQLCKDMDVDVPPDERDAKRAIGTLIISDKSLTAAEIAEEIVKKFGIKKSEEEIEQRKNAISSICANSANGPLYEAFLELGQLYSAAGNWNAANTYNKVCAAIKDLEFEITEGNAKSLHKGKTKVPGVGKGSADKMYEFVTTGTIQKLEEKRAETA